MRLWAQEKGLAEGITADDILLAQIEEHQSEVVYTINATAMTANVLARLPGCVRLKIAWLGSPLVGDAFPHFDAVVSNFPTINARHASLGLRTFYLTPSYEPQADYAAPTAQEWSARPIDLFFAGGYSRHHRRRAELLQQLSKAAQCGDFRFRLHLDSSRYTGLAETTPLGLVPPFSAVRRPKAIRQIARPAVFGKAMFRILSHANIVINMAIDIADADRGNMRCFETLSAGALLLSDDGTYPEGFRDGDTIVTYEKIDQVVDLVKELLNDEERRCRIAKNGKKMVRERYSKAGQWAGFRKLCGQLS